MKGKNRNPYHGMERSAPSGTVTPQALQAAKKQIFEGYVKRFGEIVEIYDIDILNDNVAFLNRLNIMDPDWPPYMRKITLLVERHKLKELHQKKELLQTRTKAIEDAVTKPQNIKVDGDLVMKQNNINKPKKRKKKK